MELADARGAGERPVLAARPTDGRDDGVRDAREDDKQAGECDADGRFSFGRSIDDPGNDADEMARSYAGRECHGADDASPGDARQSAYDDWCETYDQRRANRPLDRSSSIGASVPASAMRTTTPARRIAFVTALTEMAA